VQDERQKAIDRHVGRQLRRCRETANVTQTMLANKVGVTFQQIQKYEGGANRIAASRLVAFAEFLEVPLIRLFEGCPSPFVDDELSLAVVRSIVEAPPKGVLARSDVRDALNDLLEALARAD
jgi:transcriptional regulator with XRE-family HTH domain